MKPCLQVIGPDPNSHRIVGMYMMTVNGQLMFIGMQLSIFIQMLER